MLVILAIVCAIIAGLFTAALFQILRGIKVKSIKKVLIGIVLMLLTFGVVFLMFMFVLLSGIE